jgi:hypothetical protein
MIKYIVKIQNEFEVEAESEEEALNKFWEDGVNATQMNAETMLDESITVQAKHPTIEQVNFVIRKLKSVAGQARKKGAFNMSEAIAYMKNRHECGTVHCASGWYVVANLDRPEIKNRFKKGYVGYSDGADLMARDLGFADRDCLQTWAYENPEIWGNENGRSIFSEESAYDNEGFDGVIKQWELVKQNLIELRMEK